MDLAVAAVYIREGSPTGTIIDCPGGSGHFVCYNLKEGNDYYLYPAFNPGHEFSFWLQTDSVSGARLGDSHTQIHTTRPVVGMANCISLPDHK